MCDNYKLQSTCFWASHWQTTRLLGFSWNAEIVGFCRPKLVFEHELIRRCLQRVCLLYFALALVSALISTPFYASNTGSVLRSVFCVKSYILHAKLRQLAFLSHRPPVFPCLSPLPSPCHPTPRPPAVNHLRSASKPDSSSNHLATVPYFHRLMHLLSLVHLAPLLHRPGTQRRHV